MMNLELCLKIRVNFNHGKELKVLDVFGKLNDVERLSDTFISFVVGLKDFVVDSVEVTKEFVPNHEEVEMNDLKRCKAHDKMVFQGVEFVRLVWNLRSYLSANVLLHTFYLLIL